MLQSTCENVSTRPGLIQFSLYLSPSPHLARSRCPHRDQSSTLLLRGQTGVCSESKASLRKVAAKNLGSHKSMCRGPMLKVPNTAPSPPSCPNNLAFDLVSYIGLQSSRRPLLLPFLNKTTRNLVSDLSNQNPLS